MKLLKPIALVLFGLILFSCSTAVEPLDPTVILPSDQNPNPTPTPVSGDYFPTAVNNSWTYSVTGRPDLITKISSFDNVGGVNYYTFSQLTATGQQSTNSVIARIRKENGNYISKIEDFVSLTAGLQATVSGRTFISLKDNVPVNTSWNNDYVQTTTYNNPLLPVVTVNTTAVSTILEKGSSVTVNGQTFNDVIKVKEVQTASSPFLPTATTTTAYYWYAKNVGAVKIQSETSNTIIEQTLKSYTLY